MQTRVVRKGGLISREAVDSQCDTHHLMVYPDRSSSPLPYEYPKNEPVCTLLAEQDDDRAKLTFFQNDLKSAVKCGQVKSWRCIPLEVDAKWGMSVQTEVDPAEELVTVKLKELQVQDTVPDQYVHGPLQSESQQPTSGASAPMYKPPGDNYEVVKDEQPPQPLPGAIAPLDGPPDNDPEVMKGLTCEVNIRNLTERLKKVDKVHDLGVELGVPDSMIKAFEQNYPCNSDRVRSEILAYWLNNAEELTWKVIADAVKELGYPNLAQDLCGEERVHGPLHSESQQPTSGASAPMYKPPGDNYEVVKDGQPPQPLPGAIAPLYGPPDSDPELVKDEYRVRFEDSLKEDKFTEGIKQVEAWIQKEHKTSKILNVYGKKRTKTTVFRGFTAKMDDKSLLDKVRRMEQVTRVEKCTRLKLETIGTDWECCWGLNRICVRDLHESNSQESSDPYKSEYRYLEEANGEGTTVYVLDSCVAKRGVSELDTGIKFRTIEVLPYAATHGTAVAGVAMSATGVARKGNLVSVPVQLQSSSLLVGLEKIMEDYDSRYTDSKQTVILNLSMSVSADDNKDVNGAFEVINKDTSVDKPRDSEDIRNIVVVAAAGNGCNGDPGRPASKRSPGCLSSTFTVAASTESDELANWSNYGSCVDIIAPGQCTTWNGKIFEGTSAACPLVSGVMAKMLSHRYFKNCTPQELKDILTSCSTKDKIGIPQDPPEKGQTPNRLLFDFTQFLITLEYSDQVENGLPSIPQNWEGFRKMPCQPGAVELRACACLPFPKAKNWKEFFDILHNKLSAVVFSKLIQSVCEK